MADNLRTATPRQIDGQLAELYRRDEQARQSLAVAIVGLHQALGERGRYTSRTRRTWPTTDAEALAACRAKVADPEYREVPWGTSPRKAVDAYDAAERLLVEISEQAAPLNDEFDQRGGWSRFFVVQANGGHIHSSMSCSTCNRNGHATLFAWNPELSGLTEANAVAKLGPALCTVCFPSAPVEWTLGAERKHCAGGTPVEGTVSRGGRSTYGECPTCGERHIVTASGVLRKHPPIKTTPEPAAADASTGSVDQAAIGRVLADAEDPEVWISTPRKGIDYHRLSDEQPGQIRLTYCGRATRTGDILPRSEAVQKHGSNPCPRCYP